MSKEDIISNVKKLAEQLKKDIPIQKYRRTRIIQEEVVDAYKTPVPSGIRLSSGKNKQVEKGDWVLIHADGSQSTYTEEEFNKVFEKVGLGGAFE